MNGIKNDSVAEIVKLALREDLGESLDPTQDVTSQLLFQPSSDGEIFARGVIATREPGILAGTEPAELAFKLLDERVSLKWLHKSGDKISPTNPICEIEGPLTIVATGERTALNFLSHLSGVATLTQKFVDETNGLSEIFDTRKTTPGLRTLEKSAVLAGGGKNHRFSLHDAILIKDNHLTGISITAGIEAARSKYPDLFLEVECDTQEQVIEAISAGVDAVLLDNMSVNEVSNCVRLVDKKCITEASGGIRLEDISELSKTGVDRISIGAITKSAPPLDISLDIVSVD